MKKIIILISLFLCVMSLHANGILEYYEKAQYNDESDFITEINSDGSVTIRKYIGTNQEVNIPPRIKGRLVTAIAAIINSDETSQSIFGADVTSVTIPKSVTSIGIAAFEYCQNLTSIKIPDNIISIGDRAFSTCTRLESVTIPDSVISIGNSVFVNCWSLINVKIGKSVTSIGESAFLYCGNLTSVIIGNNVTSIGDNAFENCTSLTSITIPSSITFIGERAFLGCTNLTSITIDVNNLNYSSENGILYNKAKTTLIQAPGGIRDSVTIPDSVTSIGNWAFFDCANLTSITIPYSVSSIGYRVFSVCTNLTSIIVDVNNLNYSSENGILYNKEKTTLIAYPSASGAVTIPNSVTYINIYVFSFNSNLTSITIPSDVTSISDYAFSRCTNLTSITISSSVTSIGVYAFENCTSLISITIPSSVTSIGERAFQSWTSSQKIIIQGHPNQRAADTAFGRSNWRIFCNANIVYQP